MSEMQYSSDWVREFEKLLFRGKHVLLYGNVHDQFLAEDKYTTARDYITGYFQRRGFDIVLRYDPVDGFVFAERGMQRKFAELVRRRVTESLPEVSGSDAPVPDTEAGQGADDAQPDPTQPPSRSRPGERTRSSSTRVDPQNAFGQLRYALSQSEVSVAAMVNLSDMLTGDASRYSEPERNTLMLMKKTLLEASIIQQGPLAGYRNTLVIKAGELKRVPEWVYMDNPFVSILQAERPERDERMRYAQTFIRNFYEGDKVAEEDIEEIIEDFADLTDGFQAWDLEALRRTSWVEKIPVGEVRELIDYFKFGLREDPWEEMNRDKVARAQEILSRRVLGQAHAVNAVCRMLTTARVGISMTGKSGISAKPKGVFFFVGPTGVGKTELAKAVTELVFGDERAFARFDMSEYKEEHAAEKLAGAPPGFVGYDEGGQLTNRMLSRPHSILLFDEIEKAHPRVLDKFLQILEDGRLTDGKGQTAYFNQAAIIFTSNIGASELYDEARHNDYNMTFEEVSDFFQERVRDFFANKIQRAEIYNRLGDNVVPFDLLRPEYVDAIGQKFLRMLAANALERYGITLEYGGSVVKQIHEHMKQNDNLLLGGRRIKTMTESLVLHPLNKWVFENAEQPEELKGATLKLEINSEGGLEVSR